MKLILRVFPLFALVLLLISCNLKQEDNKAGLKVKVRFEEEPMILNEVFSKLNFIKLEANNDALVRHFTKVIITDDYSIIFSKNPDNMVVIYDRDGNYLTRICNIGKGAGEFISLHYMYVDSFIYLYDSALMKLLCYNMDGKFIKEQKMPYRADNVMRVNSSLFITATTNNNPDIGIDNTELKYKFNIYRDEKNLNLPIFPIDASRAKYQNIFLNSLFDVYNADSLTTWNIGSNLIYNVDLKTFQYYCYREVDFGKNNLPVTLPDKDFKSVKDYSRFMRDNHYAYLTGYKCLNNREIYCSSYDRNKYWGITNKDSVVINMYKQFHVKVEPQKSIELLKKWHWIRVGYTENGILFSITSKQFLKFYKQLSEVPRYKSQLNNFIDFEELERVALSTTIKDNPIIVELQF